MKYVDVTRAILEALAAVHPRGIHAEALAALVSCEDAVLRKELWLLRETGAVSNTTTAEIRITDAAIRGCNASLTRRASGTDREAAFEAGDGPNRARTRAPR